MNLLNSSLSRHLSKLRHLSALVSIIVGSFALSSIAATISDTWTQWRGPNRDGTFEGSAWNDSLDALSLKWRQSIDDGYSGPVVLANKIFTFETLRKSNEVVRCFDRQSGEELWSASWEGAMRVPFFAASNGSWVRSTPATDGESLFVSGMRDVLVSLDVETGRENWRVDFVDRYKTPVPSFGYVCSPLIEGDFIFTQAGASLLKLNKRTGETVWRSLVDEGGMNDSAFSSPVFETINGIRQLVIQNRTALHGVNAETGEELWSQEIPAFRGMNILPPTKFEDGIFTSSYGGKSIWVKLNHNQSSDDQAAWEPSVAWENRSQAYMSSPVVIGSYVYLHLRNQKFTCLDLKTGESMWETDRKFGKYWSIVNQGDKLLALDQEGILFLIQATPDEFRLIDERKISEQETWAHLAVAGSEVIIREQKGISVYEWDSAAPLQPTP